MMKHSEDFKREAVRIALTSGLSRERVAADLGSASRRLANGLLTIARQIWWRSHRPIWPVRMSACAWKTVSSRRRGTF
jgi:transposase